MKSFRRLPGAKAAVLAVVIVAPLTAFARAEGIQAPSLRLFAASQKVKLTQRNWAVHAPAGPYYTDEYGVPTMRLPDGRYDITVKVTRRYARLFETAPHTRRSPST